MHWRSSWSWGSPFDALVVDWAPDLVDGRHDGQNVWAATASCPIHPTLIIVTERSVVDLLSDRHFHFVPVVYIVQT